MLEKQKKKSNKKKSKKKTKKPAITGVLSPSPHLPQPPEISEFNRLPPSPSRLI
jgi:hypothetical protein